MRGGDRARLASAFAARSGGRAALCVAVVHGSPFSRKSVGMTGGAVPLLPMKPNTAVPPLGAITPFHMPAVFDAARVWPDGRNVAFQPWLKLSPLAMVQLSV